MFDATYYAVVARDFLVKMFVVLATADLLWILLGVALLGFFAIAARRS